MSNAERLAKLPNSEQAYLIEPLGDDKLVLAALSPKGVYYAAQTMRQLLSRQIGHEAVSVPLATVTDWPDMARAADCGMLATRRRVMFPGWQP